MRNANKRIPSKIIALISIDIMLFILLLLVGIPKGEFRQEYVWQSKASVEDMDTYLEGIQFEKVQTQCLENGLPKGSYVLTVIVENAPEKSFLQVKGATELSSIYSDTVSCSLSPYGTRYEIPFENYQEGNSIFLQYYTTEMSEGMIGDIQIASTSLMTCQMIILFLLCIIPLNLVVLFFHRADKRKWGILIGIAVVASIPLLRGYIYYGHDTLFHVTRIEGLKGALLAGQFPARVSAVQYHDYGYVSSALYPELFLYFPALLRLLNIPISYSYCIFWFAMNLLTAYVAWQSFTGIAGNNTAGMIGAIIFTLLPYRLENIYLRGAFGEALVLTWLPLVLWGVYEILYGDYKKWPFAVIGFTGVLQSHILTTANVAIICVLVGLCSLKKVFCEKQRLIRVGIAITCIFFLNLWFLVPFIMLYRLPLFVKYMGGDFLGHVLLPSQLFEIILEGTGNSYLLSEGTAQEMPFSIGAGLIIGIGYIVAVFVRKKFTSKKQKRMCLAYSGLALFFYWTTTVLFPWQTINRLVPFAAAFISNLPWRRLGVAGLFLTAAVVIAVCQLEEKWKKIAIAAIMAGIVVSSGSFLFSFVSLNEPYIVGNRGYEGGTEDELYLYFGTDIDALKKRGNLISTSTDQVRVEDYSKFFTKLSVTYSNDSDLEAWMEVPLNYYPGYVARDEDGKEYPVVAGNNNIVRVILPANSRKELTVLYENCTLYRVATLGSAMFSFVIIIYMVVRRVRQNGFLGGKHG